MSYINSAMDMIKQTEASLQSIMVDALAARAYEEIPTIAAVAKAIAAITLENVRAEAPARAPRRRRLRSPGVASVAPPAEAPAPPPAPGFNTVASSAAPADAVGVAESEPHLEASPGSPAAEVHETPAPAADAQETPAADAQAWPTEPAIDHEVSANLAGDAPASQPESLFDDQAPSVQASAVDPDIDRWPSTVEPAVEDAAPPAHALPVGADPDDWRSSAEPIVEDAAQPVAALPSWMRPRT